MTMGHSCNWIRGIQATIDRGIIPIIAEIKSYSPSAGDLLRGRRVEDITREYQAGGAAFLSVVTGKWFRGSLELLERVAGVADRPILRKDFIVNREQIRISRDYGASAVLLTTTLLARKHLLALMEYCLSIGITPLVEVANLFELEGLKLDAAAILAINNKNIASKETDNGSIEKSLLLHGKAASSGAGALISASGIRLPAQGRGLFVRGFDALLIGTALLQAKDAEEAVRTFAGGQAGSGMGTEPGAWLTAIEDCRDHAYRSPKQAGGWQER